MNKLEVRTSPTIYAVIGVSIAVVTVVDLLTPLGVSVWMFFLLPLAMCLQTRQPRLPYAVAAFCSVVIVVDYFFSPAGTTTERVALANRAMGLVVMWGFALTVQQTLTTRLAIEHTAWIEAGLGGLAEPIRGDLVLEALGSSVLQFLATYVDAKVAVLYVLEGGDRLRRVAGFALDSEVNRSSVFPVGEGLVGQVARQGKAIHVTEVPSDYVKVSSALGQHIPRELLIAPAIAANQVNAVIELGFFRTVEERDLTLLERLAEPLGIAVRSARDRSELENLLAETQGQAEELQTQQEELRVSNEELEEQEKALRDSQARLELQQGELERINAQLEERTEMLMQQKASLESTQAVLTDKGKELERASRYKSEFLANMSHELRTPLNSSLILAKLLADNRDGNLTAEQVKFAQSISSAGNDLLDLINDILDLSKIEAGKMDVRPETIRLTSLADSLSQTFAPVGEQKGVAFAASVAASAPAAVETDPQRLQQILNNLVSNAIKFTERGDVSLHIRGEGSDRVSFVVRDTGIGIAPADHQVVFEAFRQADGTTNRKYGGTGLGLSISRDLARLLGGEITLQSEAGHGSTFTLTLPLSYSVSAATAPMGMRPHTADRAPTSEPLGAPQRASRRVTPAAFEDDRGRLAEGERVLLVVEDDVLFARIVYDLAHELGFRCVTASSADEGVELAQQLRPTAIILDMSLPDHSGLTVLDRLKRDPATRHIPVQVASVEDFTQTALEMGAAGYMLKPVRREQLVDVLSKLESKFGSGLRSVLIVEDDPVQRESICLLLTAKDVRCVSVDSAAAALEALRTSTHDCMVLDISLPDASGFDLLERMAAEEQYSFPPVIIYTGRSLSSEDEQRLRKYSKSIIIKGARSPERLLDEVTLFLHQVESNLLPERRRMLAAARSREALFENKTILLVEDDVRNIFALSSVLEPRGVVLKIARNGREALDTLRVSDGIDMVLMDIMMPEMDGYEAMRQIRQRPEWQKVPILALTARAMRDDQERCLAAGANDYIAKPIDVDQLLSLMRVWMPR